MLKGCTDSGLDSAILDEIYPSKSSSTVFIRDRIAAAISLNTLLHIAHASFILLDHRLKQKGALRTASG
jgi:hypothetical protein